MMLFEGLIAHVLQVTDGTALMYGRKIYLVM